jgi:hypothetical protein
MKQNQELIVKSAVQLSPYLVDARISVIKFAIVSIAVLMDK